MKSPASFVRDRLNLSHFAIRFSALTISFWIAVVVAGLLCFSSLKYALFPDITFPVVIVSASSAPLETALDVEAKLTNPLEEQLQALPQKVTMRSTSYPGRSVISLEFPVGAVLGDARQAVETALASVTLPEGAGFKVIPFNLNESAAISYAMISETQDLSQLTALAKTQIVPALSGLPGVLKVELLGEPVSMALETENASSALPTTAKGATASDDIQAVLQRLPTLVRFDRQDAIAIQAIKRGDANTLEVVSRIEKAVETLQTNFPDVQLIPAATQANYIREATQATIDALGLAVLLAVLVIFPFLGNLRATLITALAIPISLLGTFIVMAGFGFNLETITLLALALVIGIIVDDAIVDVENITRHISNGEAPREAAINSTRELGLTVAAASLTIVAVFLPVGLMGGVIGQFFKPFGLTISAAVLTSLFVARTLSPVLAARWLKPAPPKQKSQKAWNRFARQYRHLLRWSLQHRIIVLAIAIFSFAAGIALIPLIPQGFIPQLDRGELNITYTAALNPEAIPTTPEESLMDSDDLLNDLKRRPPEEIRAALSNPAIRKKLFPKGLPDIPTLIKLFLEDNPNAPENLDVATGEATAPDEIASDPLSLFIDFSHRIAEKLEESTFLSPDVESIFTIIGDRGQPNKGTLHIKLSKDRQSHTAAVKDQLRHELPELPGIKTSVEEIQFVDTGGEKPLQVALQGDDLESLSDAAQAIEQEVRGFPALADVTATGQRGESGEILEIEHRNGQRAAYIRANVTQDYSLGEATDLVIEAAQANLPDDVTLNLGGDSARIGDILSSFSTTISLAVVCILAVLIFLFGNWLDPLVVLFSLPLSIVGAMLALLLTQSDFGLISLLGLIFLLGLINKNAILLVDYINQLRRTGLNRHAAILKAAPIRLRPILMTTASTILGMLPIAIGWGAGAELRAPMAIAIIGGLIASTLLSLIVVPVLYASLDGLRPKKQFQHPN